MLMSCVQLKPGSNLQENLENAKNLVVQAASQGAKLVVLPEEFATIGLSETQKLKAAEASNSGPIQELLANLAKKLNIWLVAGTIPIQVEDEPGKIYARCIVWDNHGSIVTHYDKMHLFDVTIGGGESYRESEHIVPGTNIATFETDFGHFGLAICYDVRFPELFREMVAMGVNIFLLPSAFSQQTGVAHWEVLLKARAIENQCYLLAANQSGKRANGHYTFGNSMIINPWGEIIAHQDTGAGVLLAEIDLAYLKKLRETFPVLTHKKLP